MKVIKVFFWVFLFPFMLFITLLNGLYKMSTGKSAFDEKRGCSRYGYNLSICY